VQKDESIQRPIWLVGMMGCGKSTVGAVLAHLLGCDFVDNDRRIEERARSSIAEIFANRGEAAFRALEAAAVDDAAQQAAVVALGGGAIAQPGAPARLAQLGTVVYLRASVDTLLSRLGQARNRPLLSGLGPEERRQRVVERLRERESAYESAEIVVDTDDQSPEAVASRIVKALSEVT
jgi:shikimate kinase/3-dehydroquinate synthase